MSHYAVLVIGENPEKQLEPFSESLKVPEYESDTVSQEEKDSFLNHYRENENVSLDLTFDEVYAIHGEDWNHNRWREVDGVWKEFSTYNPNSKWDWYSLGGRWLGYFKLRAGKIGERGVAGAFDNHPMTTDGADSARKCDIDFDAMRDEAGEKAGAYYDRFYSLVGDQPLPNWEEIRKRHGEKGIEAARKEYRNHPVTQILNGVEEFRHEFLFRDITEMAETRGDYIEQARRSRIVTFAVLYNGTWYERGEMGWWGMVHNEVEKNEWENQFYQLLESLPDNTLLSVFDCHI